MNQTDRIAINRANARFSTGPRSPEGKAAVSQNRTVHALTGAQVLLPGESRETYDALLETLFEEHSPDGVTERFLVESIAQNQWRLIRVAEMESEILAAMAGLPTGSESPAAKAARHMISTSSPEEAHAKLTRYETSLRRSYHQALTQLRAAQNARRREEASRRKNQEEDLDQLRESLIDAALDLGVPPEFIEKQQHDSNPGPAGPNRSGPGFDNSSGIAAPPAHR